MHKAATQAKENLQLQKDETIILLADKGYHTGAELQQCQQENMITHVAYKEQPSVKHIANEFLAESFTYNKRIIQRSEPACRQAGTRTQWILMITTSDKIHNIINDGRLSANIRSEQ